MTQHNSDNAPPRGRRVIKRYSNRKLYDTRDSRYVTLLQISEMVRAGEDVQIIDNASKEDKTEVTLALIISEELRAQPRAVPLGTLRGLIQDRGGRVGTDPGGPMASEQRADDGGRRTQDERPTGENPSELAELRAEVARLAERVAALEAGLRRPDRSSDEPH